MFRSPWFAALGPRPQPTQQLYCFHYAGGSSAVFREWPRALSSDVEVIAIRLPGHVGRYGEPLITDARALALRIYEQLLPQIRRPYSLFGHSMGATLAYEVACLMQQHAQRAPKNVILAARRAPHLPRREARFSTLPDLELIESIRDLNGTSHAVLERRALVDALLPIWRADFAVAENYAFEPRPRLTSPVTVYTGKDDPWVSESDASAWHAYAAEKFSLHVIEGGHFFIDEQPGQATLVSSIDGLLHADIASTAHREAFPAR